MHEITKCGNLYTRDPHRHLWLGGNETLQSIGAQYFYNSRVATAENVEGFTT